MSTPPSPPLSPGLLRIRQVVFVAEHLQPAQEQIQDVLGLNVSFHDPIVAKFGVDNAVFPIGGDFLEVVAPNQAGTSAERFMKRRGGDSGYMAILQCTDNPQAHAHVTSLGIRVAYVSDKPGYLMTQFHPADCGGLILEMNQVRLPGADLRSPMSPWSPAGEHWASLIRRDRTIALLGIELQSDDPAAQADLYSRMTGRTVQQDADGSPLVPLEGGRIRFVPARDGRGAGLGGIDVAVADRAAVLAAAERRGLKVDERCVMVCGVRVHLY